MVQAELFKCEICNALIPVDHNIIDCPLCGATYQRLSPAEEVVQTKLFTVNLEVVPPPVKADFVVFTSKDVAPEGHKFGHGELCSGTIKNLQDRWDWFYLRVIDEDTEEEVCREYLATYLAPGATHNFKLPVEIDALIGKVVMPNRDWHLRCEIVLWWL